MTPPLIVGRAALLAFAGSLIFSPLSSAIFAQETSSTLADQVAAELESPRIGLSDEAFVLSPFTVSTSADKGYRATNSISGTRLDTPIRELPMPIEVITESFLRDTGSSDLRQSLRYSSGIILQSQNDQGANAFYGAGGVHNPEGATANKTQSTFKIRGYITDVVLRDGYRRQSATDSVNIGRIEVIRGPAALLYGIGNFGGIVNYLPKTPNLDTAETQVGAAYGSHDFKRAWVDTTAPLGGSGTLGYRLTGAWQNTGNQTELYDEEHWFASPSFEWKPFAKTDLLVDLEFGESREKGLGFQSVRARSDVDGIGQADRLQNAGFVQFAGKDPRRFRWSGPDTYRDSDQFNLRVQGSQELARNLNLLAGYNHSRVDFDVRDVNGTMRQNVGPVDLRDTITVLPLDVANGAEFALGQSPNTIFQYQWSDLTERSTRDQVRVELNYALNLFEERKWLAMRNSFLFGRSTEKAVRKTALTRSADNTYNYKSPTDTSYIRFGRQGDGSADVPMVAINRTDSTARNTGDYAVYQGKFLDDRLILVGGVRSDRNENAVGSTVYHPTASESFARRPAMRDTTDQFGAMLELTPQLSVYALRASGIQPNFDGLRDAAGDPLGPTVAKSKEIGLKVELANGRISGTISKFKIKRSGVPFGQWWMPTLKGNFDSTRPIIYNLSDYSPASVTGVSNGGNGAMDLAISQWNAAVASGAIYQRTTGGVPTWYVNASQAEGAAYLDEVIRVSQEIGGWAGWLFTSDEHTNNGWEDRGDGGGVQSYVQQQDQSEGWDAQILITPTDNLQFIVTYAHTKRVITHPGKFIKYPHPENRWAPWFYPDGQWGLTGYPIEEVYTDPSDTSTWTGIGWGAGQSRDDTPKHSLSLWSHYKVGTWAGPLKGLEIGFGGQWESEREYFSGISVAGQKQTNKDGKLITLKHKARLNLDLMLRYPFEIAQRQAYAQLNIYNLQDDRDLYGLIYAPGRSVRLEVGLNF
ncbi:hypothetical protein AXK11_06440 [Cephaloticoccus primus]|uniref:TonB-dependent receptor plug domain-containing protein n=1 Tax=Cephaloticoccus primus TaxID=1548207 RepID=A0A139SLJ0_9BACT|nr:TonB-dependent receptor plug domain-containing protein [Cephaloticoccus primus]KXU35416.1 hypothetical protein AXK11_06440 [Cephaloticoccus primus]